MEENSPEMLVTRTVRFSAAHRLYLEDLTDKQNWEIFGKCATPHGHGHDYRLEVTFQGRTDPKTGMFVHFQDLKRLLQEVVEEPFDHHNLNADVKCMEGIVPTSENIVTVLWKEIDRAITGRPFGLHKLTLFSASHNRVEYFGPSSRNIK